MLKNSYDKYRIELCAAIIVVAGILETAVLFLR
jgi:hypothetical protein